jgi:catechol 2,3-dioxygenase-like lactoylglutathione lyase family enzyme
MDKEAEKLKFMCSLITVSDIKKSRDFYENVLGQKVESDYGRNVSFEGFAIHLRSHFQTLIENKEIVVGGNNFELYFESDNLEQIVEKLKTEKVEFIHEIQEAPWRQLAVKFYDPDRNIIEIGETMEYLSFRLHQQGNSFDEISKMTGLSREFIEKSVQVSIS